MQAKSLIKASHHFNFGKHLKERKKNKQTNKNKKKKKTKQKKITFPNGFFNEIWFIIGVYEYIYITKIQI